MDSGNFLYAEERKLKILEVLDKNETMSVLELTQLFGVTGATIRSDLRELESEGKLLRTHGGAISLIKRGFELKPDFRTNDKQKQIVAKKALRLIQNNESIIIDTGTTNIELAKAIAKSNLKNLKIITNDFKIATILEEHYYSELYFIGGAIRKGFHYTYGNKATKFISEFIVDKAFIGTNAFDFEYGFTTPSPITAEIKKEMILYSNKIYILFDSSKINIRNFSKFADLKDIHGVITDLDKEDENYEKLKSLVEIY